MNILHVIPRYLPAQGGAELHAAEISRRLAAAGHAVTVLTTDVYDMERFWTGEGRRIERNTETLGGVRVVRVPAGHLPAVRLTYPGLRRVLSILSAVRPVPVALLHWLSRGAPYTPAVRRLLARSTEPYDVVAGFIVAFETVAEAAREYAAHRNLPFIFYPLSHLGAGPAPGQDALSRFYTMRHQLDLARRSTALMANTPAERDFYVAHGAAAAAVTVTGPGVNPAEVLGGDGEAFRRRHALSAPIIASLSTLQYDKGTVHLVEAVRALWAGGTDVHLVLAGAILRPFAQYLAGLPAADRARLTVLGSISDEEKRDLLAGADIFAMPSRTDSFCIVYLEAWLYGKPVIGARTWGVMDVIRDGVDGLLVPFGDVPALTAALADLLHDPARRAAMGEAGRAKVYEAHTWDAKFPKVAAVYERVRRGQ